MGGDARRISYQTLPKGVLVRALGGEEIGTVEHVLEVSELDVFDGIVGPRSLEAGRLATADPPAATDAAVALLLVAYGAVSGRLRSTPVSQARVFVALGLLVGSRVLDKERPAQTMLGGRCHGDLSHPPWPDGGSGVALGSPSGGPFIQAGAGRRVGDEDAA